MCSTPAHPPPCWAVRSSGPRGRRGRCRSPGSPRDHARGADRAAASRGAVVRPGRRVQMVAAIVFTTPTGGDAGNGVGHPHRRGRAAQPPRSRQSLPGPERPSPAKFIPPVRRSATTPRSSTGSCTGHSGSPARRPSGSADALSAGRRRAALAAAANAGRRRTLATASAMSSTGAAYLFINVDLSPPAGADCPGEGEWVCLDAVTLPHAHGVGSPTRCCVTSGGGSAGRFRRCSSPSARDDQRASPARIACPRTEMVSATSTPAASAKAPASRNAPS